MISVGALDNDGNRAIFSNYNLPDVNEFVDLAAPGVEVLSTIPDGLHDAGRGNGTSFAAPIVSGIAALLVTVNPMQSPSAIRNHLLTHAGEVGEFVSYGIVDASAAVNTPLEPILTVSEISIDDNTDVLPSNDADSALDGGETAEVVVKIRNDGGDRLEDFTAQLVSNDPDITVVTGTAEFSALAHGESAGNAGAPFAVEVADGALQNNTSLHLSVSGFPDLPFQVVVENEAAVPQSSTTFLDLTPDHTWIVSGETTVATGTGLRVRPGTTVKFEEGARLEVWDVFQSVGTATEPVYWKNRAPVPTTLFAAPHSIPAGTDPFRLVLEDISGDGVLDVIVVQGFRQLKSEHFGSVAILEADGQGSFLPHRYLTSGDQFKGFTLHATPELHLRDHDLTKVIALAQGLVAKDVNSDGMLDLLLASSDETTVTLYRGLKESNDFPPDGIVYHEDDMIGELRVHLEPGIHLRNESATEVLTFFDRMVTSDLDLDGSLDLAWVNQESGVVETFFGSSDGSLAPGPLCPTGSVFPLGLKRVAAADVTGDAIPDLLLSNIASVEIPIIVGEGDRTFSTPTIFSVGHLPNDIAAANVAGDGRTDLISANVFGHSVDVFPGSDSGGFLNDWTISAPGSPISLVTADVTGDGVRDLVTANFGDAVAAGTVGVFPGDSSNGFATENFYQVGVGPEMVLAADVTGDGSLDILAHNTRDTNVSLLRGEDGFSSAVPVEYGENIGDYTLFETPAAHLRNASGTSFLSLSEKLSAADFDSDEILDIAYANTPAREVEILAGNSLKELVPKRTLNLRYEPNALLCVDLDRNSEPDIVTVSGKNRVLTVLLGDGSGGFLSEEDHAVGAFPAAVVAKDLTGDGFLDLATANRYDNSVSILVGNGEGSFLPRVDFPVGQGPSDLVAADVTGDGNTDLVTANLSSLSVLVGDGLGGFAGSSPSIACRAGAVSISHSNFALPSTVLIDSVGTVSESTFLDSGGVGLSVRGSVNVSDCGASNCVGAGFGLLNMETAATGLTSADNRGSGILAGNAVNCSASENRGSGVLALGEIVGCYADGNNNLGLGAGVRIDGSAAHGNLQGGFSAPTVTDSTASYNSRIGITAAVQANHCLAVGNEKGIESPDIENCLVVSSFGPALSQSGAVNDSAILENASVSTESVEFNNAVIAGNGSSATPDEEIVGMYIAGNKGGGVRGVLVRYCTIVGNKGPGIDDNDKASRSNVAFNEGPGVVGGLVDRSYVMHNEGGDLVEGAAGETSSVPVSGTAPAFLADVQIRVGGSPIEPEMSVGVGKTVFTLTFSKEMKPEVAPWVTFGQTSPYTSFVLSSSEEWIASDIWRGFYHIGSEVGEGTHTLRVSGAVAQDGFTIPPDTYHSFTVNYDDGLSISNGSAIGEGSTCMLITWDNSDEEGILFSEVVRSLHQSGPYGHAGTILYPTSEFRDHDLSPDTKYFYRVYELNSNLRSNQRTPPFSGTTCNPYNHDSNCRVDARDLLQLLAEIRRGVRGAEDIFGTSRVWME